MERVGALKISVSFPLSAKSCTSVLTEVEGVSSAKWTGPLAFFGELERGFVLAPVSEAEWGREGGALIDVEGVLEPVLVDVVCFGETGESACGADVSIFSEVMEESMGSGGLGVRGIEVVASSGTVRGAATCTTALFGCTLPGSFGSTSGFSKGPSLS